MPKIDTKSARDKLHPRHEPYWQRLAPGLFVGYRVSVFAGEGSWRGRWRDANGTQQRLAITPTEFHPDLPGKDTKFQQAEKIVRTWHQGMLHGRRPERLTLGDAVMRYLQEKAHPLSLEQVEACKHADLPRDARNVKKSLGMFQAQIVGAPIGRVYLDQLRSDMLNDWQNAQLAHVDSFDTKAYNAAKATLKRKWASLVAALNWAFKQGLTITDQPWRAVTPKGGAGNARLYIPTDADIVRLYSFMPSDVVAVCKFLQFTGCRPGEAYKATVEAFDRGGKTLRVDADTKTGQRLMPLSSEASEFVASLAKNKTGKALLLVREDGKPWSSDELSKRFRYAREQAGFSDEFVPYSFRHRWITDAVHNPDLDAVVVALAVGTSVEMIKKNYAKLKPGHVTAALDNVARFPVEVAR